MTTPDDRGRTKRFVQGHNQRGKENPAKRNPESRNKRTGRWRARLTVPANACSLAHIGGCSHRVEVHHIDGCTVNNSPSNLIALCTSHHRLVENGRIDLANPIMPRFVVKGGKRRYEKRP